MISESVVRVAPFVKSKLEQGKYVLVKSDKGYYMVLLVELVDTTACEAVENNLVRVQVSCSTRHSFELFTRRMRGLDEE